MTPVLISLPILGAMLVVQSAILSRIPLLHGTADLVLLAVLAWAVQERVTTPWHWAAVAGLMVGLVSALPLVVPLAGYAFGTGLVLLLKRQIWQARLLAMLVSTFLATLAFHLFSVLGLRAGGTPIPWVTAFNTITLPSALINLLLAVPVYAIISDVARWLYPEDVEL